MRIPEDFGRGVSRHEIVTSGTKKIHWWYFEKGQISFDGIKELSTDILNEILGRRYSTNDAVTVRRQINGIIGSANNDFPSSDHADLFHSFRQRFVGRPRLKEAIEDPQFEKFLKAKALELAEKAKFKR
jgi:hypothetical protein